MAITGPAPTQWMPIKLAAKKRTIKKRYTAAALNTAAKAEATTNGVWARKNTAGKLRVVVSKIP